MLTSLLTKETIALNVEAEDWMDAIRKSAQPLLANGSIEPRYIDNMIQAVKDLGPYIAIAPGVAIAHAKPEQGVVRMGMSLATLKHPVSFGNTANDPIRLVLTLAAQDHDAHLNAMGDMVELLGSPDRFQRILDARQLDEVCACLKEGEQEANA